MTRQIPFLICITVTIQEKMTQTQHPCTQQVSPACWLGCHMGNDNSQSMEQITWLSWSVFQTVKPEWPNLPIYVLQVHKCASQLIPCPASLLKHDTHPPPAEPSVGKASTPAQFGIALETNGSPCNVNKSHIMQPLHTDATPHQWFWNFEMCEDWALTCTKPRSHTPDCVHLIAGTPFSEWKQH